MTSVAEINGASGKRRFLDAIIIVPLEEEFEIVSEQFTHIEDVTDTRNIRFVVSIPSCSAQFLLVKQWQMGRSGNAEAVTNSLFDFDATAIFCVGIAAGISTDVAIGDVCYTGTIMDIIDNAKVSDVVSRTQAMAIAPSYYDTPRELSIPFTLTRLNPETKRIYTEWVAAQETVAQGIIPGEFTGRMGEKERVAAPKAREGLIACGLVSDSAEHNAQLKAANRKVLALETESAALFSIAQHRFPAMSIRGISDYAGVGTDKARFERETNNQARKLAALNAATFLTHHLRAPTVHAYFERQRAMRGATAGQPSFLPIPARDKLEELLIKDEGDFTQKLRDLSPSFSLIAKGYRPPMPRVRVVERTGMRTSKTHVVDIRDALQFMKVIAVHIPREYPDFALSWTIARNLLSVQIDDRQVVPCVIDGRSIRPPRYGIGSLADPDVLAIECRPEVRVVFVIDEFDFGMKHRAEFLRNEIKARPEALFIIISRSAANSVTNSEFATMTAAYITTLRDIAFAEIAHFLRYNYEIDVPSAEVISLQLVETFHNFKLSAHPSYFAGIPRSILVDLLKANRRAELIQLAVAGYLSFVVSDDRAPVTLSRTTRQMEVAFETRVRGKTLTEVQLTKMAEEFAKRFDFNIAPARFITTFFDKGILHIDNERVFFTLPFMEYYLVAVKLIEEPAEAVQYFSVEAETFDYETFTLYAEMGAAPELVTRMCEKLDRTISDFSAHRESGTVLLNGEIFPSLLKNREQYLVAMRKRLEQAEEDVRNHRDQTREKQRLLDANDELREEAAARVAEASTSQVNLRGDRYLTLENRASAIWSAAVILLGSGAERLQAPIKRELITKVVNIAEMVINSWTRQHLAIDFEKIKEAVVKQQEDDDNKTEETISDLAKLIVDIVEFVFLMQPLMTVITFLCDEAHDKVLAESILKTNIEGKLQTLIRTLWLADIDPSTGRRNLRRSVIELPAHIFLRHAVAGLILTRVYWKQWEREGRLGLLNIANESLKGIGKQYEPELVQEIISRPHSALVEEAEEQEC